MLVFGKCPEIFTAELSKEGYTLILCINPYIIAWANPSQEHKASETELGSVP